MVQGVTEVSLAMVALLKGHCSLALEGYDYFVIELVVFNLLNFLLVFAADSSGSPAYSITDWYFYNNFNLSMVFFYCLVTNFHPYCLQFGLDRCC